MANKKAIFIAATGQNVGKTTLCLGLLAGLKKRFKSVGFIKPVGQEQMESVDGVIADKDVVLFKEHFGLLTPSSIMSPVLCPPGFTREFLDHKINSDKLLQKIKDSFSIIEKSHEYVLAEGTGHVGVGTIFNLNNAKVASSLDLDVVLIATAGIGSTFDNLALNIEMCHTHNVKVRGVILNRVLSDKRKMIADYFPKALSRWKIPLLGLIPYLEYLSIPTMKDYEGLLASHLLSGHEQRLRHFSEIRLIAGSLDSYRKEQRHNQLIITPASREEIILTTLDAPHSHPGLILTGDIPPTPMLLERIKKTDIPVLYTSEAPFNVMKKISSFTAKIQKEDLPKIETAIQLIEHNVDFSALT